MSILEILEAHYDAAWNYQGRRECACGHEFTTGYSAPIHRAHAAQVLEQHELEAKAEAWEEGYDAGQGDGHTGITENNINPYANGERP